MKHGYNLYLADTGFYPLSLNRRVLYLWCNLVRCQSLTIFVNHLIISQYSSPLVSCASGRSRMPVKNVAQVTYIAFAGFGDTTFRFYEFAAGWSPTLKAVGLYGGIVVYATFW